ncbi:MAG: hypothetical protein OEY28_00100 [Nitrospira sp.]|nr:hypothetical protein [Nitrospira sp.]
MDVSAYAGGQATLSKQIDNAANLAAVGLSVYGKGREYDHEILSMTHGGFDAIVKDGDDGVPLGHVASFMGHGDLSLAGAEGELFGWRGFKPWPGRIEALNPALILKGQRGEPFTEAERIRLELGARHRYLPPFTIWPLIPGLNFSVTVSRLFGGTSIDKAYLWCVELTRDHRRALCDGNRNWVDYPIWLAEKIQIPLAGGVQDTVDSYWNHADGFALRVKQWMITVYSNIAETLALASTYNDALTCKPEVNGERVFPHYANERVRVSEIMTPHLQLFDPAKDFDVVIPSRARQNWHITSAGTAAQADVYLTTYGLLRRQAESDIVPDAE